MNENKKYSNCALIDNDFFLCFSSMQKIDGIVLFKKIVTGDYKTVSIAF